MYELANRIKELRKQRGMSQATLGERIGRSKSAIVSYETDRQAPPLEVLESIADVFNVSLDYLVGHKQKGFLDGLQVKQSKFLCDVRDAFLNPSSKKGELSAEQAEMVKDLMTLLQNSDVIEN